MSLVYTCIHTYIYRCWDITRCPLWPRCPKCYLISSDYFHKPFLQHILISCSRTGDCNWSPSFQQYRSRRYGAISIYGVYMPVVQMKYQHIYNYIRHCDWSKYCLLNSYMAIIVLVNDVIINIWNVNNWQGWRTGHQTWIFSEILVGVVGRLEFPGYP